jgi:hypothetical protein
MRLSGGSERTVSKTSEASIVLSFPPLKPTNHGVVS